jgi:hypothetical protein
MGEKMEMENHWKKRKKTGRRNDGNGNEGLDE